MTRTHIRSVVYEVQLVMRLNTVITITVAPTSVMPLQRGVKVKYAVMKNTFHLGFHVTISRSAPMELMKDTVIGRTK